MPNRRRVATALIGALLSCLSAPLAARAPIQTAGPGRPPLLDALADLEQLGAVALSDDGRLAAAAVQPETARDSTTLLIYDEDAGAAPLELSVPGVIRDLLFARASPALYALEHKPPGKRKLLEGNTYLLRIDTGDLRARRVLRLPPSARGLDHHPSESALLVACRNEIRTVILPEFRSGPLYRVEGQNLSLAAVGQGTRLLIGQDSRLLLIDLDDPQGRDAMPLRAEVETPDAITTLVADSRGPGALARLAGGSVRRVSFDPLTLQPSGVPGVLARSGPEPAAPRPVAPPGPVPRERLPEPEPAPEPEPRRAELTVLSPAVAPPAAQVSGRIGGPAAELALSVVLFGPDNILREALRVRPDPQGHWQVDDLEPGRYRVLLDGGGGRQLACEPPFLMLEIEPDRPVQAGDFRVSGAL